MTVTKIRSSSQLLIDQNLDANSKKIVSLAAPVDGGDAVNKTYADGLLAAADAMVYKGVIDCAANPNYPAANAGDTYKISVSGKIGGASGHAVLAGDLVICTADSTAAGTQAAVGAFWDVVHVDSLAGTVTSSAVNPIDNQIVILDSITGSLIQNSLATIDDSGSITVPSGQYYKVGGIALVTNASHTGEVTGDAALTITPNAVTLAKLAIQAAETVLVNATSGAAVPTALELAEQTVLGRITGGHIVGLTAGQIRTLINVADGATAVTLPTFITREAPSGTKNGSNPTFTLAQTPTSGSEMIFLNGVLLNPGAGNDYTISTNTLTMLTTAIPVSTDVLLASYRF